MRTAIKTMENDPTVENMAEVQSRLDIAVKRNITHRNTAARAKVRLSKLISAKK